MNRLARQRCTNHAQREAVALCPGCKRYFCRECVTEHDDRVLCAACLARQGRPSLAARLPLAGLGRLTLALAGVGALWFCFHLCGRALLAVPAPFHEGTYASGDAPQAQSLRLTGAAERR